MMQLQRDVAGSMGKIKDSIGSHLMSQLRDLGDVEELTGVVLDTTEHHEGQRIGIVSDGLEDVFSAECFFSLTRLKLDQMGSRIQSSQAYLRCYGVSIGRKCATFDHDLGSSANWLL